MTDRGAQDDRSDHLVTPTIPVRYVIEMLEPTGLTDHEIQRILRSAQIAPQDLREPKFRVSVQQLMLLYEAVRRAADDELFGYLARPVPVGAYATLLRLLTGCTDAQEALDGSCRFYGLFEGHAPWAVTVDGDEAWLTLRPRTERQANAAWYVHTMLLTSIRTAAWLVDQKLQVRRLMLDPCFDALASETRFLFGCDPEFVAGPGRLGFDAALLKLPVVRRPEDTEPHLRRSLLMMLTPAAEDTLAGQVRRVLTKVRPRGSLSLGQVATALGTTGPTLSRHLRKQGLSFQQVKDEVCRDLAIALLTKTRQTVGEIAEALGYSEPSAFSRAFVAWTGVRPGRYRVVGRDA